jgi:hypothetical protein
LRRRYRLCRYRRDRSSNHKGAILIIYLIYISTKSSGFGPHWRCFRFLRWVNDCVHPPPCPRLCETRPQALVRSLALMKVIMRALELILVPVNGFANVCGAIPSGVPTSIAMYLRLSLSSQRTSILELCRGSAKTRASKACNYVL